MLGFTKEEEEEELLHRLEELENQRGNWSRVGEKAGQDDLQAMVGSVANELEERKKKS